MAGFWKIFLAYLRDEEPQLEPDRRRPEPPKADNLRYTVESCRAIDTVNRVIGREIRRLATERAQADGRSLVTLDDTLACVPDALREFLANYDESEPG